MRFKTIKKEDVETMSFDDLAYVILKEKGKKMKTAEIFKIVCDELNLGEKTYEEQIGDFFALLATEKRFIQLTKGYWDLRENHTSEISIKEIEDELDDEISSEDSIDTDSDDEDYYDELDDVEDDKGEDDLKDLVVVEEGFEDDTEL